MLLKKKPVNVRLIESMPKDEYDHMIAACDVGLIFLDHRFTIPNFPSRLLSYMQAGLPVLACTDVATDIGKVITEGGFGWWCESNDLDAFAICVQNALKMDRIQYEMNARQYLKTHYNVEDNVNSILKYLRC